MEITKIPKKTVTLITPKNVSLVDKDRYQQKRVAAYCRVSTDSEEQLTSYKTQKKVYTEMIQANKDWTMVDIYADEGISGTMTKNRDDFNRMIKDCLAGSPSGKWKPCQTNSSTFVIKLIQRNPRRISRFAFSSG